MRERADALARGGQHAGIVIAVIEGKDSAVYGFGRGDQDRLPDADTVYEIGSVTKTMTGLLLAQAVLAAKAGQQEAASRRQSAAGRQDDMPVFFDGAHFQRLRKERTAELVETGADQHDGNAPGKGAECRPA